MGFVAGLFFLINNNWKRWLLKWGIYLPIRLFKYRFNPFNAGYIVAILVAQ